MKFHSPYSILDEEGAEKKEEKICLSSTTQQSFPFKETLLKRNGRLEK